MPDHVPLALLRHWIDDAEIDTDRFYEDHRDPPTVGNVTFRFADFLHRSVDKFAEKAQECRMDAFCVLPDGHEGQHSASRPDAASTDDRGVTAAQAPAGRSRAARMAAEFNTHPNSLGPEHVRALAVTLMGEESQELLVELTGDEADRSKIARELADVAYVAYTIAWSYGIDLDAALREIHRAAMDKIHANVRREGDGKIIKPPGFVPPDMTRAVERGLPSTDEGSDVS